MSSQKDHGHIEQELHKFLDPHCPGIKITVALSPRWKRLCLEFRWNGFANLLPEERFRLMAKHVPPEFVARNCADAVWVELTPAESIEEYLKLPRSEDVADRAAAILKSLSDSDFFAALEDELVRVPPADCPDDFTFSRRVLSAKSATPAEVRDACLVFMHHRAYNDWEVLREVRPIAQSGSRGRSTSAKGRDARKPPRRRGKTNR
jgi:hypothetical protein